MRKLVSNGLVMFAGMVSIPATGTDAVDAPAPAAEYRNDPRLESLQRFFQRRNCPAADVSEVFLEAADAHNLDWRLLPSISFIESTGGKFAPNNNLFGWDSGRAAFSSMSAAIHRVAFSLAHSRLYRNKDLEAVLETYNPNADYAGKVKSVMRRIAPSESVE
jgi:hypothetical protein